MGWWKQRKLMMQKYGKQVVVKVDDDGEYYIDLTDEMLEALDVKPGDTVIWRELKDGSWELTKK